MRSAYDHSKLLWKEIIINRKMETVEVRRT
jgi:hypothetical protein